MFEHLLEAVDTDYVRYITHVEATIEQPEDADEDEGLEGALTNAALVAPGAAELPAHDGRCRAPRRRTRRSVGTTPAGAARSANSSSAMADPKAENALRLAPAALEDLEARWDAARDYLKSTRAARATRCSSELAADPNLWDDQDHAREVTTELGRLSSDLESFDALRAHARRLDRCSLSLPRESLETRRGRLAGL